MEDITVLAEGTALLSFSGPFVAVSVAWMATVAVACVTEHQRHRDPWRTIAVFVATVLLPFVGFALWVLWTVVAVSRDTTATDDEVVRRRKAGAPEPDGATGGHRPGKSG